LYFPYHKIPARGDLRHDVTIAYRDQPANNSQHEIKSPTQPLLPFSSREFRWLTNPAYPTPCCSQSPTPPAQHLRDITAPRLSCYASQSPGLTIHSLRHLAAFSTLHHSSSAIVPAGCDHLFAMIPQMRSNKPDRPLQGPRDHSPVW
jgi:hypothetical protein